MISKKLKFCLINIFFISSSSIISCSQKPSNVIFATPDAIIYQEIDKLAKADSLQKIKKKLTIPTNDKERELAAIEQSKSVAADNQKI